MHVIASEHFCHVPAIEVRFGDQMVVAGFVGQVNRVEASGDDHLIIHTYVGGSAPTDGSASGRSEGWKFPRPRRDSMVKVYAPLFSCGRRSLELRRLAQESAKE